MRDILNINYLKIFPLLLLIMIIASCDYRCIPAESYGTSSTISAQLYSNPFYGGNLRQNVFARCKPGCDNCNDQNDGSELWLNLATEYDPNFNYEFGVSGKVSFCSVKSNSFVDLDLESKIVANLFTSKINYFSNNKGSEVIYYNDGEERIKWHDVSGKNNHATREGVAPSYPECRDEVLFYSKLQYMNAEKTERLEDAAKVAGYHHLIGRTSPSQKNPDNIIKLKKGIYPDLTDTEKNPELDDPLYQLSKNFALQYEYRQNHPYDEDGEIDEERDELSFNEEKIYVPYGCLVKVYLHRNFTKDSEGKSHYSPEETQTLRYLSQDMNERYYEYDLSKQKIFKNKCTEMPTGWIHTWYARKKLKHGENSVRFISAENAATDPDRIRDYKLGYNHPTPYMNDNQDFIKVPPGCKVDVWGGSSDSTDKRRLTIYHSSTHITDATKKNYRKYIKKGGNPEKYDDPENKGGDHFDPYYYLDYYEIGEDYNYYDAEYDGDKNYPGFYILGPHTKKRVRNATPVFVSHADTDYRWQTRVLSAKIENDPNPPPGFNASSSIPKIFLNAINNSPAIYFDGNRTATDEPDYYDFNQFGTLLAKPQFTIIFILKKTSSQAAQTILSANDENYNLLGRIYIEGNKLKYYQNNIVNGANNEITHDLATIDLSNPAVITIQKTREIIDGALKYKINTRVNYKNVTSHETIEPIVGYKNGLIGGYFGLDPVSGKPTLFDSFTGYIAQMIFFKDKISEAYIAEYELNLLEDWGIGQCPKDPFLKQLRLRIGNFSTNEEIFNDQGEFIMPQSYKSLPKGGNMMIRYEEPPTMTTQEIKACPTFTENQVMASDNEDYIAISMRINKGTNFVTDLYKLLVEPVEKYIKGGTTKDGQEFEGVQKRFFDSLIGEDSFIPNLIKIALTFYIIFTAISYLLGLAKYSNWDLINKITKAAIITALTSNWNLFNTYFVMFFRDGALDIGNKIVGVTQELGVVGSFKSNSKVANIFRGIDELLSLFMSSDVNAKIWALLFHPPLTGAVMVLLFYMSFYIFVEIVARVLIVYISVFIMITFAFIIAPIFLTFSLFKQTQALFTKWLDLIIGYALQYIMLATAIGFFSSVIKGMFINLIGYSVCWRPILYCCKYTIFTIPIFEWYKPRIFDYSRFNLEIKAQYLPNIWDIALLLLVMYFFKKFLNFAIDLASRMSGGVSVSNLTESISKTLGTSDMIGAVKSTLKNVDSALNEVGDAVSISSRIIAAASPVSAKDTGKVVGGKIGEIFGEKQGAKAEKFIGKFEGGIKNPYKKLKKKAYDNSIGQVNRSVFGIRKESEQILINNIKNEINNGINQAILEGGDKEEYAKDAVKKMLQKKGVSQKNIDKILNSKQLIRDVKNHKLQTKDAKNMLNDHMIKSYNEARKNGESKKEARKSALKSADQLKQRLGENLEKEDMNSTSAISKKYNKLTRNDADRRLKNFSIMSERLEREFEGKDYNEDANKYFFEKEFDKLSKKATTVTGDFEETISRFSHRNKKQKDEEKKFEVDYDLDKFFANLDKDHLQEESGEINEDDNIMGRARTLSDETNAGTDNQNQNDNANAMARARRRLNKTPRNSDENA
jgi:type IV secretory pathway VirB6-like protein